MLTCDSPTYHHRQEIQVDMTLTEAQDFASILDGTSSFFKYPPREFPIEGSLLARCGICGYWFNANVEEGDSTD